MHGRFNRLILTTLIAVLLILVFGCTQPDDILAPVSTTRIILQPERLPILPDSLYYHIWIIDTIKMCYSVGSFYWSADQYKFLDLDSNVIDSVWTTDYDILDPFYSFISISIENIGDPPPDVVFYPAVHQSLIGPVILQDTLCSTDNRLMKMVFPLDLWLGYGFFAMETPSDSGSQTNDVSGVWFAEYLYDSLYYSDTTSVKFIGRGSSVRPLLITPNVIESVYYHCNEYNLWVPWICEDSSIIDSADYDPLPWVWISTYPEYSDTIFVDHIGLDTTDADSMVIMYYTDGSDTLPLSTLESMTDTFDINKVKVITDSNYIMQDSLIMDTFVHTYLEFDFVTFPVNIDTIDHIDTVTIYSNYDEDTETWLTEVDRTYTSKPFMNKEHELRFREKNDSTICDKFVNSFIDCPDLSDSEDDFEPEYDKKWHYKGWVLSPYLSPASSFAKLNQPSWSQFFLKSQISPLDAPMISTGTFKRFDKPDDGNPYTDNHRVPKYPGEDFILNLPTGVNSIEFAFPDSSEGKILITLEPDGFDNDSINFPLILFIGDMPSYDAMTQSNAHSQVETGIFDVTNWSSTVAGYGSGFPIIHVTYIRE